MTKQALCLSCTKNNNCEHQQHVRGGIVTDCTDYSKQEPATCPDCGHPEHEGKWCPLKVNIMQYCKCDKRTPADLKPADYTKKDFIELEELAYKGDKKAKIEIIRRGFNAHDCPALTEPEMPLREQMAKALLPIELSFGDEQAILNAFDSIVSSRDQQVRKAFALEVHSFIKEAVQFVSPKTEESVLAHILEMAEEK